jgi:hypothetical protein
MVRGFGLGGDPFDRKLERLGGRGELLFQVLDARIAFRDRRRERLDFAVLRLRRVAVLLELVDCGLSPLLGGGDRLLSARELGLEIGGSALGLLKPRLQLLGLAAGGDEIGHELLALLAQGLGVALLRRGEGLGLGDGVPQLLEFMAQLFALLGGFPGREFALGQGGGDLLEFLPLTREGVRSIADALLAVGEGLGLVLELGFEALALLLGLLAEGDCFVLIALQLLTDLMHGGLGLLEGLTPLVKIAALRPDFRLQRFEFLLADHERGFALLQALLGLVALDVEILQGRELLLDVGYHAQKVVFAGAGVLDSGCHIVPLSHRFSPWPLDDCRGGCPGRPDYTALSAAAPQGSTGGKSGTHIPPCRGRTTGKQGPRRMGLNAGAQRWAGKDDQAAEVDHRPRQCGTLDADKKASPH